MSVAVEKERRRFFHVRLPHAASVRGLVGGGWGRPGSSFLLVFFLLVSFAETTAVCTGLQPDVSVCAIAFSPET